MSVAQSQQPAPSTQELPPTNREEIISLLERTTSEVVGLRKLHDKYAKRAEELEALLDDYRKSDKALGQAYADAVKELSEVKVALAGVQQQLVLSEQRAAELAKELAKTRKQRDAAVKRERLMMLGTIAYIILRVALH